MSVGRRDDSPVLLGGPLFRIASWRCSIFGRGCRIGGRRCGIGGRRFRMGGRRFRMDARRARSFGRRARVFGRGARVLGGRFSVLGGGFRTLSGWRFRIDTRRTRPRQPARDRRLAWRAHPGADRGGPRLAWALAGGPREGVLDRLVDALG